MFLLLLFLLFCPFAFLPTPSAFYFISLSFSCPQSQLYFADLTVEMTMGERRHHRRDVGDGVEVYVTLQPKPGSGWWQWHKVGGGGGGICTFFFQKMKLFLLKMFHNFASLPSRSHFAYDSPMSLLWFGLCCWLLTSLVCSLLCDVA